LAVKPFPCGHCEKSFSRKDALKVRYPPCDTRSTSYMIYDSLTRPATETYPRQRLREDECCGRQAGWLELPDGQRRWWEQR
jgi:uncharacterized CHY-type Zn-finger protein